MIDPISPKDLASIKENCLFWSNNCGGCETCSQVFGNKAPEYDHLETYQLILMIEARNERIRELELAKEQKWTTQVLNFFISITRTVRSARLCKASRQ